VPQPVEEVFHAIKNADERDAGYRSEQSEDCVEEELGRGDKLEGRQGEKRTVTEGGASDHRRGDRGKHDRTERLDGEIAQDELEGKEHPGDGCVERRRDPPRRPTGD